MKLVQTTEATHNGKTGGFTASEMVRREQERLDQVEITVRCAHCPDWTFTGPSFEAREAASLHREEQHPGFNRTDGKSAKTRLIEAARIRRTEREEADRDTRLELARQRDALEALDGGLPQPVLEEAEPRDIDETGGVVGAESSPADGAATPQSSASPNTDERTGMECKIDGCPTDASHAPKAGPTARLCPRHRAEKSAELSAARTSRPHRKKRTAREIRATGGGQRIQDENGPARHTAVAPAPTTAGNRERVARLESRTADRRSTRRRRLPRTARGRSCGTAAGRRGTHLT